MALKNVPLAAFLAIVSANMIQASLVSRLLEEEALPNFVSNIAGPLPEVGQFSNSVASSAAAAATRALGGFKNYIGGLRTGLQGMDIPPRFTLLRRFADGEIMPNFGIPSYDVNYPGAGYGGSNAAAAAATAAAAAASAANPADNSDYVITPRLYRHVSKTEGVAASSPAAAGIQRPTATVAN